LCQEHLQVPKNRCKRKRERERSSHKLSKDLGKRVVGSMAGKFQTMKLPTTFDMSKFWEKS
jgi:hypothetical protein